YRINDKPSSRALGGDGPYRVEGGLLADEAVELLRTCYQRGNPNLPPEKRHRRRNTYIIMLNDGTTTTTSSRATPRGPLIDTPLMVGDGMSLLLLSESKHAVDLHRLISENRGKRVGQYVTIDAAAGTTLDDALSSISNAHTSTTMRKGVYPGIFYEGQLCGQIRMEIRS
ncbi:hypothetical protein FOZ63_014100, partial [Perkinsus olseni]